MFYVGGPGRTLAKMRLGQRDLGPSGVRLTREKSCIRVCFYKTQTKSPSLKHCQIFFYMPE